MDVHIKGNETDKNLKECKLIISIKDTGVGMSEEKIKEITNGNTCSEGGTSEEKGYGFELSLVKHLVHKSDGSMEI